MPIIPTKFQVCQNCRTTYVGKHVCYKPRPDYLKNENNHNAPKLPDDKHKELSGALAKDGEGKASGARRPHVRFTLCRVKLLDVDAKYGSVKDLLDGLQYAGLIHGDREDQITLEVNQVKVAHYSEEKTMIEIEDYAKRKMERGE